MTKLKKLFQKAWTAVTNPGQDERVTILVAAIAKAFQTQKANFVLDKVVEPIEYTTTDLRVATQTYYEKLLHRFWSEGVPGENRRKTLSLVAKKLKLEQDFVTNLNNKVTVILFSAKLAECLSDGIVNDDELKGLSEVTSFVDLSVPDFVRRHVATQSIGLLRSVFAAATSTGKLDSVTWENLLISANQIGLTEQQLKNAASPLARSFAEHVLADVKADNVLTGEEEEYLRWLLRSFDFDDQFLGYVDKEVKILRERTQIASGNLKPIGVPVGTNLHAGEILYFCQNSALVITRHRKSGPRQESHEGCLLLSDNRILFDSASKSLKISYRSIVGWSANGDLIQVSIANKPEMMFRIRSDNVTLAAEKFSALVQLHSQTMRRKVDGQVDRHIPRDVRQRVWQRYGGKCAECGALEYLEFDHIVPVAKGGSNTDQNVQLLCRRCNSQKSDKI